MSGLLGFGGLKVTVVPSWLSGWAWVDLGRPARRPTKAEGRRGSKRAWKRQHPHGWHRRWTYVEPDHVLRTPAGICCTARQYEAIKQATRP